MTEHFIVRVRGSISDKIRAKLREPPLRGTQVERGEEWDGAGRGFFRVHAEADDPDEARALVAAALSGLDGFEVGPVDRHVGAVMEGRFDEIHHRAIEHFVVESMMGAAAEQERLHRVIHGHEESHKIMSVDLRGAYPETVLRVDTYQRVSDRVMRTERRLWKDEEFVNATQSFQLLERWIGDFLMYRRGG